MSRCGKISLRGLSNMDSGSVPFGLRMLRIKGRAAF